MLITYNWQPFCGGYMLGQSEPFGTENTKFYLIAEQPSYDDRFELKLYLASTTCSKISFSSIQCYQVDGRFRTNSLDFLLKEKDDYIHWTFFLDKIPLNDIKLSIKIEFEEKFEESAKSKPAIAPLDHQKGLATQMSSLRLDSKNSDVILVTTLDGREFATHKLILSARSTVFEAMFSHGELKENVKNRVEIEDVSGEVMEALLKYVYEGNIEDVEKLAGELLAAADKYNISLLVGQCIQSMMSGLSVENAARFFYYANLHQLEDIKKSIAEYISKNKAAVLQSAGWLKFIKADAELMEELLKLVI